MRVARAVVIAGAALGFSAAAHAEICNEFVHLVLSSATTYVIVLKGDVRTSIDVSATSTDALVNPFAYVNQHDFAGSGTSSVSTSLNGNGNTVVTFTGSNPILSSYTFSYGASGNDLPHFGVDGSNGGGTSGSGPTLTILDQYWSEPSPTHLPSLTVSMPTLSGSATDIDYLMFYADVTASGSTAGQWFETPFDGSQPPPSITLTDDTSNPITLSNTGYFITETYLPLDDLNYPTNPPPDVGGSPFTPLPSLDGANLTAGDGQGTGGGSLSLNVPEPASWLLLATGLAGVLPRRRGRIPPPPDRT